MKQLKFFAWGALTVGLIAPQTSWSQLSAFTSGVGSATGIGSTTSIFTGGGTSTGTGTTTTTTLSPILSGSTSTGILSSTTTGAYSSVSAPIPIAPSTPLSSATSGVASAPVTQTTTATASVSPLSTLTQANITTLATQYAAAPSGGTVRANPGLYNCIGKQAYAVGGDHAAMVNGQLEQPQTTCAHSTAPILMHLFQGNTELTGTYRIDGTKCSTAVNDCAYIVLAWYQILCGLDPQTHLQMQT